MPSLPSRLYVLVVVVLAVSWSWSKLAVVTPAANDETRMNTVSRVDQDREARRRELLIGGETAPFGRYPYYVSLQHYCGGALIAPDMVLTAGHCKPRRRGGDNSNHPVRAAVGRYRYPPLDEETRRLREDLDDEGADASRLRRHDGKDVEYVDVVAAHRHPDWSDPGDDEFVHDFAILKLANGVFDKPVVRINRDPRIPRPGSAVRVLGAGDTVAAAAGEWESSSGDSRADILQQVDLQAIDNASCEKASSSDRNASYTGRIHPSHLCTGYAPDNSRDACDYDSGGPIVVVGNDDDGSSAGVGTGTARAAANRDLLVGLVSWGMECADPDFPGR
jgi:hypothetical protein